MPTISGERKLENREKIIRSAVEIISKKGIQGTTLGLIGRKAGLEYAAVRNFFPTKETIVSAYYEDRLDLSVERLKTISGFDDFTLQEQLQTFFETQLEILSPDREFVDATFWPIAILSTRDGRLLEPIRSGFSRIIADLFEAAVEVEEIPDQLFSEQIYHLFWLFNAGLVLYWLRDGSNQFRNTTVLLDKSLDLAVSFLKAGIINKVLDIVTFLLKTHVLNYRDIIEDPVEIINKVKAQFMGDKHA